MGEDFKLPEDLLYDDEHSWVRVEEGGVVSVGLIEPAVKKVDEFVFIKLPERGTRIKKGEVYVSLEAMKWSGHIPSPVSGEIIEVNEVLFDEPSRINRDPYGSWIMKVRLENEQELKTLHTAEEKRRMLEKG